MIRANSPHPLSYRPDIPLRPGGTFKHVYSEGYTLVRLGGAIARWADAVVRQVNSQQEKVDNA